MIRPPIGPCWQNVPRWPRWKEVARSRWPPGPEIQKMTEETDRGRFSPRQSTPPFLTPDGRARVAVALRGPRDDLMAWVAVPLRPCTIKVPCR